MMHKGQTHIRRNCFSIGIISSKLQSGCYSSSEPDHLECEGFLSEVGGSPETNGQIELPKGLDALPGDDPVKGRRAGPDRGQIDLQEPEGLGVDDVEAAASVHEDLGKPDIADDGIDNERVLPRACTRSRWSPWSKVMGLSDQSM